MTMPPRPSHTRNRNKTPRVVPCPASAWSSHHCNSTLRQHPHRFTLRTLTNGRFCRPYIKSLLVLVLSSHLIPGIQSLQRIAEVRCKSINIIHYSDFGYRRMPNISVSTQRESICRHGYRMLGDKVGESQRLPQRSDGKWHINTSWSQLSGSDKICLDSPQRPASHCHLAESAACADTKTGWP
jgi:hypothetical protein